MAKKRGKYDKSAKIAQTDGQLEDDLIALMRREFANLPNLSAFSYHFGVAKPAIRRRIIDTLFPIIKRPPGQPKRALPDLDVLLSVEDEKKALARELGRKIPNRMAVLSLLEKGYLRLGRDAQQRFIPNSIGGKQEIARAIAAVGRARIVRKSKIPRR